MRAAFPDSLTSGIAADLSTAEGANAFIAAAPDADILVNNVGTAFIRYDKGIEDIAAISMTTGSSIRENILVQLDPPNEVHESPPGMAKPV